MIEDTARPYHLFMLALCILVLVSLGIEVFVDLDPDTRAVLFYADTAVCGIFFLDFLHSLARAQNRIKYFLTWGWIDLISSIPAVSYVRWGRAARVARILRVLRGVRSVRTLGQFILQRRAQSAVLAVSLIAILAIVVASIAIIHLERGAEGNIVTGSGALWWAVVTVTTVGYGDRYPVTAEGRLLATALMVVGISLFSTFTAFIASWFMQPGKEKQDRELAAICKQLSEIKQLLQNHES